MMSEAVLEDKQYGRDTLVICFGGHPWAYGVFELRRPLTRLPVDKIFFKDLNRVFFLKGVPGISRNVTETCDFLAEYLKRGQYKKVMTMGLSAGSHAAVMFGVMLNVDRVIGIGPRTQITGQMTLSYPGVTELIDHGEFDPQYDDLAGFVSKAENRTTDIHLFFSTDDRIDVSHAMRLHGFSNVTLHGAALGGHCAAIMSMAGGGTLHPQIKDLVES